MKKLTITILITVIVSLAMSFHVSALGDIVDGTASGSYTISREQIEAVIESAKTYLPDGYDYHIVFVDGRYNNARWGIYFNNRTNLTNGLAIALVNNPQPLTSEYSQTYKFSNLTFEQSKPIRFWDLSGRDIDVWHGYIVEYSTFDLGSNNEDKLEQLGIEYQFRIVDKPPVIETGALETLIAESNAITNVGYTQTTWQIFTAARTAAVNLLNTTGYAQEQVNSAATALQNAKNGLIRLPDITELQSLISQAKSKQQNQYRISTWNALQSPITNAENLIKTNEYTQAQVTSAKTALETALNNLEELPDISGLQALLSQAKAMERTSYTSASWQTLQSSIASAESTIATKDYTALQISIAQEVLQNALDGLTLIPDISGLQALISQAKDIEPTGYTSASWQSLQAAIQAAETLLTADEYTTEQRDNAITVLQAAIDGLAPLPDITGLQALMSQAASMKQENYTETTWNELQLAIQAAESLINSGDYTGEQINAVMSDLQHAVDGLSFRPGQFEITGETVKPVLDMFKEAVKVVVPVAIGLFALILCVIKVPSIFKKYVKR